jgi:alpha-amylase
MYKYVWLLSFIFIAYSCKIVEKEVDSNGKAPFTWDNATVYFMMTDRFYNGDASNDFRHTAENEPAPYRGFMGGDLKGITAKIKEGYFTDLGINAIWMTPVVENIQGSVDEGTGNSFPFHGYWARDWSSLDARFGTADDLREMIAEAHARGIRILIDVVANHTGPVTALDSQWPDEWVKTGPRCIYQDAQSTIDCTLVENLPDIRTESDEEVELPSFLVAKWKEEGRYETEIKELATWFAETGYPRTAVNYILKWLVDFVKEFGIDGFRVDTVKHTEDYVWTNLWRAASTAFEKYKLDHPEAKLDDEPFYMVGEVYNYYISGGREYDYGDRKVDFFKDGFHSLINFDFKTDANNDYETIFSKYDSLLHGPLVGKSVLNYISSHDDGGPFDLKRERPIEAGTKLLLCPGGVQVYYGDETSRSLTVPAQGDATLRSFMNWDEIAENAVRNGVPVTDVLTHWQKLGKFRRDNLAVGAGAHKMISAEPYIFERSYTKGNYTNKVVVGLDLAKGMKTLDVSSTFSDGDKLYDYYGESAVSVNKGKVSIDSPYDIVLLGVR